VLREPGDTGRTTPSPGLSRLPELLDGLTGFLVRHTQVGDARELPAIADLAAYRIAQEALTNAHRYGDGHADLAVTYEPGAVTIEVVNRIAGRGGDGGFGLLGMRERAAAAGGTVTAGPTGDGRFRLLATLPTATHDALEPTP
jgi:signal transduction histidine kinase